MEEEKTSALSRLIQVLTKIKPSELRATLLSFSFIFLLMFAYNMLKPVRDSLAPEWSDFELAWLWFINFVFSAIAVSIYGFAISRGKLKNVIPGVYAFFAASFVIFYIGASSLSDGTSLGRLGGPRRFKAGGGVRSPRSRRRSAPASGARSCRARSARRRR